jgi:hypothetical protein
VLQLGPWDGKCLSWTWCVDPSEDRLYQHQGQSFFEYHQLPGQGGRQTRTSRGFQLAKEVTSLPMGVQLSMVRRRFRTVYHSGWRRTTQFLVQQQPSIKEFLRQKLDMGWVTGVQKCGANFQDMADSIERSELIGISDRSYKDDMGTAAWRLFYINLEDQQWTGQLLVHGQPADQSAFRSELAGLYAMITLVNSLVDYYEV